MLLLLDEDDDDDDDEEEEEELDMMKNSRICLRKGGDVVVTDYLTGGREDECQFSEAGFPFGKPTFGFTGDCWFLSVSKTENGFRFRFRVDKGYFRG